MRGLDFGFGIFFMLLLLVSSAIGNENENAEGLVPVMEPWNAKMVPFFESDTRRRLSSFQICSLCTCCGGAGTGRSYCLPSPCCYAINCNIPNRPFGFCSFTPKTCNCFNCHI